MNQPGRNAFLIAYISTTKSEKKTMIVSNYNNYICCIYLQSVAGFLYVTLTKYKQKKCMGLQKKAIIGKLIKYSFHTPCIVL